MQWMVSMEMTFQSSNTNLPPPSWLVAIETTLWYLMSSGLQIGRGCTGVLRVLLQRPSHFVLAHQHQHQTCNRVPPCDCSHTHSLPLISSLIPRSKPTGGCGQQLIICGLTYVQTWTFCEDPWGSAELRGWQLVASWERSAHAPTLGGPHLIESSCVPDWHGSQDQRTGQTVSKWGRGRRREGEKGEGGGEEERNEERKGEHLQDGHDVQMSYARSPLTWLRACTSWKALESSLGGLETCRKSWDCRADKESRHRV